MRRIPLTQGQFALVDDEVFDAISKCKWQAKKTASGFYALRFTRIPKPRTIYMHRQIMDVLEGGEIDHKNRNTLDNQKGNLRLATTSQNAANRKLYRTNTSGFKGVCWNQWRNLFMVNIYVKGKTILIGHFKDAIEAARAYDAAATLHYGEFASTNKSLGLL